MAPNPTDVRVAGNVRAEMARRKLSQGALAEALGVTQQSLSRRLTSRTSFSVAELERIASKLEVNPSLLLDGSKASA